MVNNNNYIVYTNKKFDKQIEFASGFIAVNAESENAITSLS